MKTRLLSWLLVIVLIIGCRQSEATNNQSLLNPAPTNTRPKREETIRIEKIPGTDLYTGIYYKVSMPAFPTGFVTWTTAAINDNETNFVQIDFEPVTLANYEKDGKWELDAQWMFRTTEVDSWYTWDNRFMSANYGGITACSTKEVGSGVHVIISKSSDHLQQLGPGGEWRDHALWRPVLAQPEPNGKTAYQLVNKNVPQGTITWTVEKYRDHSQFIQIDTKAGQQEDYKQFGKWFNDSLFTFTPMNPVGVDLSEVSYLETKSGWWWWIGGLVISLLLVGVAVWGVVFYRRKRNKSTLLHEEGFGLSMSDIADGSTRQ